MKRFLSILLSVTCMLSLVAATLLPTFAAEEEPAQTPAARVGYTVSLIQKKKGLAELKNIKEGLVTGVREYQITDAEGLEKLAHIANGTNGETTNNFSGYTFYLANDIDMEGVTHEPIGLSVSEGVYGTSWKTSGEPSPSFRGTFDGQGHAILNWKINDDGTHYKQVGLFGQLAVAEIRNLIIDESCSITYSDAGGTQVSFLAAYAYWGVVLSNISVRGTMQNIKSTYVGGLIGRGHFGGNAIFTNCDVRGNMTISSADHVGGLFGSTHWEIGSGSLQFTNCRMAGNITSNNFTGGFIAIISRCPKASFTNCINNGIINGYSDRTGGFVGSVQSGALNLIFTDCYNYGESRNKPFLGVFTDALSQSGCGLTVNGTSYDTPIAAGTFGTAFGTFVSGEDPTLNLPDPEPSDDPGDDPGESSESTSDHASENPDDPQNPVDPPASDYVGYTSSRVEPVSLGPIPNILNFDSVRSASYKITTPEGLVFFSRIVNSGETLKGRVIYLANDIDMTGITDMEPIGKDKDVYFSGTFDGQGNIIENLVLTSTDPGTEVGENERIVYVGLFGVIADATIRNLILGRNCVIQYEGPAENLNIGGLAGGVVQGIGKATTFDNCWNLAKVTGNSDSGTAFAAGIVARTGSTTYITNCTNSGVISGNITVAGFSGYVGMLTIRNSRNTGTITLTNFFGDAWHTASGFIGRPSQNNACKIEGCINNGDIIGPSYIGAFYGAVRFAGNSIKDCVNYGSIQASSDSSGATSGVNGAIVPADGYPGAGKPVVAFRSENVENKAGEVDTTLALMETLVPDYTPVPDTEPGTTDSAQNDTVEPTPITTEVPTEPSAENTTKTPETDKKGCKSILGGAAFLPVLLIPFVLYSRKKEF